MVLLRTQIEGVPWKWVRVNVSFGGCYYNELRFYIANNELFYF
jgi:hypothetical protein